MTRAAPPAHFLHIGKTGGTALKYALDGRIDAGRFRIVLHPHAVRLAEVPAGEKVFFLLREPLSRFASGFSSRRRKGRPRYHFEWSAGEARAFSRFASANALAEAISADDAVVRAAAQASLREIQHVRDSFWTWLGDPAYLVSRLDDVLFIGFQDTLDADFDALKNALGLAGDIQLPTDPVEAHRAHGESEPPLSQLAQRNLEQHYAADCALYRLLRGALPRGGALDPKSREAIRRALG